MSGAIPSLLQYAFIAWCSVKKSTGTILLYYTEVSGHFHASAALPPKKEPAVPME
jgi:hypothetical protein